MIIDRFAFKIIYPNFINRFFVRFNDSSMTHLFNSQYSINFIWFRFLVFSLDYGFDGDDNDSSEVFHYEDDENDDDDDDDDKCDCSCGAKFLVKT